MYSHFPIFFLSFLRFQNEKQKIPGMLNDESPLYWLIPDFPDLWHPCTLFYVEKNA